MYNLKKPKEAKLLLMDDASKLQQAFMKLQAGLPRHCPGGDENTLDALSCLPPISGRARIYDLGCGTGAAAMLIARVLQRKIICYDSRKEYLAELRKVAYRNKLLDLVQTQCGDILEPSIEAGSIDLIWSEGSINCIGFDKGLAAWRPLLSDSGVIACSELSWRVDKPSTQTAEYWKKAYPEMRTIVQNVVAAESLGYVCHQHFTEPQNCWWDEYYTPWLRNIEKYRSEAAIDEYMRAAIANAEEEIELFRQFNHEYGYQFYIFQKSKISIERASFNNAAELAELFRISFKFAMPSIPTLHTPEEDLSYFASEVMPNNEVFLARKASGVIVGFIAFNKDFINHLYLLPNYTRQGIGLRLLNIAKLQREKLQLWAFQKNQRAKEFYLKNGFKIMAETDGENNEEKEPDILFKWSADGF